MEFFVLLFSGKIIADCCIEFLSTSQLNVFSDRVHVFLLSYSIENWRSTV